MPSPSLPLMFFPISWLARKCKAQSFVRSNRQISYKALFALAGFPGTPRGRRGFPALGFPTEETQAGEEGVVLHFQSKLDLIYC